MKYGQRKLNKKTILLWKEERDKVAKSYDVAEFKKFFRKWQNLGVYDPTLNVPKDKVIEITMRKMVYSMKSATEEERAEAKEWLESRGYKAEVGE